MFKKICVIGLVGAFTLAPVSSSFGAQMNYDKETFNTVSSYSNLSENKNVSARAVSEKYNGENIGVMLEDYSNPEGAVAPDSPVILSQQNAAIGGYVVGYADPFSTVALFSGMGADTPDMVLTADESGRFYLKDSSKRDKKDYWAVVVDISDDVENFVDGRYVISEPTKFMVLVDMSSPYIYSYTGVDRLYLPQERVAEDFIMISGFEEGQEVDMELDGPVDITLSTIVDDGGDANFDFVIDDTYDLRDYIGEYSIKSINGAPIESFDKYDKYFSEYRFYVDFNYPTFSSNLPEGDVGRYYEGSININESNNGEITDVEGLPDGLSFNYEDGIVSGIPTKDGSFEITIRSENSIESYSLTETIVINGLKAPKIEDQIVSPGDDVVGESYPNSTVEIQNKDNEESTDSIEVETDEDGKFSFDAPEDAGSYDYSATAIAFDSRSDNTDFTVEVVDENISPTISVELPEGETGKDYKGTITTDVGEITDVDNLPTGLKYDDGVVSGVPTHNSISKVVITAENGDKVSTETVIMIIKDPVNNGDPIDEGNNNEDDSNSDKDKKDDGIKKKVKEDGSDENKKEDEVKKKISTGEISDKSNNNIGYYAVGGLGLLSLISLIGLRLFKK